MNMIWARMTADEAAEIIQHNDMVAFSGFTPAVHLKLYLSLLLIVPTNNMRRKNRTRFAC